jgi:hypothetical protein
MKKKISIAWLDRAPSFCIAVFRSGQAGSEMASKNRKRISGMAASAWRQHHQTAGDARRRVARRAAWRLGWLVADARRIGAPRQRWFSTSAVTGVTVVGIAPSIMARKKRGKRGRWAWHISGEASRQ